MLLAADRPRTAGPRPPSIIAWRGPGTVEVTWWAMKRTRSAAVLRACVFAGALAGTACEGTGFPVFPTPVVTPEDEEDADSAAPVADDSELKAEPPAPIAPVDDAEIADTRPVLVASQARGRFVDAVFGHEFALYRRVGGGLTEVEVGRGAPRGDGSTAYRVRRSSATTASSS